MKFRRIIRRVTGGIVDAAFLIKSPANLPKAVVILHGASCTGKSYALRWIKRRHNGFVSIEMDRFLYSKVLPVPDLLKNALNLLKDELRKQSVDLLSDGDVLVNKARALIQKIENADLLEGKHPRHRSMVELLKACLVHDTVIATCGDLPPPRLDNGYYEMLGRYTSKTALHVLIAPESKVLLERIRRRGRESEMDRWLESNRRRLANRAYYDLVLSGTESTGCILKLIRNSISHKRDR